MTAAQPTPPPNPVGHNPHPPDEVETLEDAVWHELMSLSAKTDANSSAIAELGSKMTQVLKAVNGDDEIDALGLRRRVATIERDLSELKELVRDRTGQQKSRLETALAYAQLFLYGTGFVVLLWGLATGRFVAP